MSDYRYKSDRETTENFVQTKTVKQALLDQGYTVNSLIGKLQPKVYDLVKTELNNYNLDINSPKAARAQIDIVIRNLINQNIEVQELPDNDLSIYTLTEDQQSAWEKISSWIERENQNLKTDPYFILKGYPGTGKTYLLRLIRSQYPNLNIFFSAPTNKASKVLGNSVGTKVRTTFSVLGLRMQHDEDEMYLDYSADTPHFSKNSLLVVDETGTVGKDLYRFIRKIVKDYGIKVLFVGDPAQLNPVKEPRSYTWKATTDPRNISTLKQPVRFDSQLFKLSMRIRKYMKKQNWNSPIKDDNDETGGVYVLNSFKKFRNGINSYKNPTDFREVKVVAWRNKTVQKYNRLIREGFGFSELYEPNDIILLAEPIEQDGQLIAHIDDEFVVHSVDDEYEVKVDEDYIPVYRLEVEGDQKLHLNVPMDNNSIQRVLSRKANFARKQKNKTERRKAWQDFWETKAKFNNVRYGYALTSHRIQGSTVHTVFLDQHDILANPNKKEAFRSLNVAATRPTTNLYTY